MFKKLRYQKKMNIKGLQASLQQMGTHAITEGPISNSTERESSNAAPTKGRSEIFRRRCGQGIKKVSATSFGSKHRHRPESLTIWARVLRREGGFYLHFFSLPWTT